MPPYRNFNYHVNLNGGVTAFNNVGGQTFYVAASGYTAANDGEAASDSNTGLSPQTPFATIQAGLSAAKQPPGGGTDGCER